jgi:hypothetical protein
MSKETGKDILWIKKAIKYNKDRIFDYETSYNCNVSWLINDTGVDSVRGTIVTASSSIDFGAVVNPADIPKAIGSVLKSGIADGEWMPIGYGGIVPVLLEDGTASTRGYWAKVSDTQDGRADITNLLPPGGTIPALEDHLSEVGHCLKTVSAGTDQISYVFMHFN